MSTLTIFLSYDDVNYAEAKQLHTELTDAQYGVWWDRSILPGQDKDLETYEALRRCNAVLWCLSKEALSKLESSIYSDIKQAISVSRRYRPGEIFLIPVRFSACEIPSFAIDAIQSLGNFQPVDLSPPQKRSQEILRLLAALQKKASSVKAAATAQAKKQPPPGSKHIATFMHVSDLHFGEINPETRDAQTKNHWGLTKAFDIFLGHEYASLELLDDYYAELIEQEPVPMLMPHDGVKIPVIMTGDLTCCGSDSQFESGTAFLGDLLCFENNSKRCLGLQSDTWCSFTVPGDHDHWPGNYGIIGGPPPSLKQALPCCPFVIPPITLPGTDYQIRFMGIDTNADIAPLGTHRLLGRGAFKSQLAKLAKQLENPGKKEVRVLLLHHSRKHNRFVMGMQQESREALDDFIHTHGIVVLLSGHLHIPYVGRDEIIKKKHGVRVLEACCGTTTQISTLPYESYCRLSSRLQRPNGFPNSLLLHRLYILDEELYWETITYFKTPAAFKVYTEFAYLNQEPNLQEIMRVWPR